MTQKNADYQVISFDLDNALYDNQPVINQAEALSCQYLKRAFAEQGRQFDFESFMSIRRSIIAENDSKYENLSRMRRKALEVLCKGLERSEEIREEAFRRFINARSLIQVEPEIRRLLSELSLHYTLVTATNGNCDIQQTELGRYFDNNWSASDDFRAKPHPEMLMSIISQYQVKPSQVLHVGDSIEKDGGCAKNAGAKFFHLAPFENGNFRPSSVARLFQLLLKKA